MKKLAFSLIFIILFTILLAGFPETLALHIAILFQWNLAAVGVMVLIQEMLMLFFILYLLKRADLSSIFKRKKNRKRDIAAFLALLFIFFLLADIRKDLVQYMARTTMNAKLYSKVGIWSGGKIFDICSILITVLISPIIEELFYRGYVMSRFFTNSNHYLDVLLSASLFTLGHMILLQRDWGNLSFYFLSGLALSLFYRYSQNIRLQILFHVSWNLYIFIASIWYIIYNWIYFHFFFSKQKQTDSYKVLSVCLFFESIEYFYILFL